jgi:hypothetical protein
MSGMVDSFDDKGDAFPRMSMHRFEHSGVPVLAV